MSTKTRPKRPFPLIATATVLALPLAALVAPARAPSETSQGVRASIKGGTLEVKGSNRADTVALRLEAGDPNRVQVDVGDDGSADRSFARDEAEAIEVTMGDGDDSVRVDDTNGAFTDQIPTTIAGGDGDDSLSGGLGAETYKGDKGNDASSTATAATTTPPWAAGTDTFRWDPGDGSDVIEGRDGRDTMLFNGAAGAETVTMARDRKTARVRPPPGNVTMDTDDVEIVDFNALGGADPSRSTTSRAPT